MKAEFKVGLMFIAAVAMTVAFAYSLGAINPFARTYDLNLAYNFAGGIEVGSPVRVMGIRVGRVKEIRFVPDQKMPTGEEVKLRITVSIDKEAWPTVTEDSRFYINLAGVIGEKFIEITPGSSSAPIFRPGALVRGEDPPRIDQLISQSYGLAGKIVEFVEQNEGSIIDTIDTINKLVVNLNQVLKQIEKTTDNKEIMEMLTNLNRISADVAYFTKAMRSKEAEETVLLLKELLWRLKPLDQKAIRKFLQQEGIRARLF